MNKIIILVLCFLVMCCVAVPQRNNYRQETIKSAQKITRPLHMPIVPKPIINTLNKIGINHQAIKITTNTGKQYVMSSNPSNGIHVTDASLSNKWTTVKNIKVNGDKKIGNVMSNANGIKNGLTSYVTTGTCIGTVKAIEKELVK